MIRSYDDAMEAVMANGLNLYDVPKRFRTPEICLAAVKQNGLALEMCLPSEKTHEVCLAAVQQNGCAVNYINHQTEDIMIAAVKSLMKARVRVEFDVDAPIYHESDECINDTDDEGSIADYMSVEIDSSGNPVEGECEGECDSDVEEEEPFYDEHSPQYEEDVIRDLHSNIVTLDEVPRQTYNICLEAIRMQPDNFIHIKRQTDTLCMEAMRLHIYPKYIQNVRSKHWAYSIMEHDTKMVVE